MLRDAGATVQLASVKGGKPPADPASESEGSLTDDVKAFRANEVRAREKKVVSVSCWDHNASYLRGE